MRPTLLLLVVLPVVFHPGATQSSSHRNQCSISLDEIEELIELVNNIGNDDSIEEGDSVENGAGTSGTRDPCVVRLDQMRRSLQWLKQSFKRLQSNEQSAADYEILKNRHIIQKNDMLKKLNELTGQLEARYRGKINDLKAQIRAVQRQLNESVKTWEATRAENLRIYTDLCIASIRAGNVKEAITQFEQIARYAPRPWQHVVNEVYEGNVHNADLILDFLEQIDLQHIPIAGFDALLEEMSKQHDLGSHRGRRLLLDLRALAVLIDWEAEKIKEMLQRFLSNLS